MISFYCFFKMKLNWFVHDQNIFASSLEVIFANLWEIFGSFRLAFGQILGSFRESSESGRNDRPKITKNVVLNKKKYMVAWRFEISFVAHVEIYFTLSLPSLVKYFSSLLEKFCISACLVTSFTVYFEVLRHGSVLERIPNDHVRHYLGLVLF